MTGEREREEMKGMMWNIALLGTWNLVTDCNDVVKLFILRSLLKIVSHSSCIMGHHILLSPLHYGLCRDPSSLKMGSCGVTH